MSDYKNLAVEIKGSVLMVTISREKAMNALNNETIAEFKEMLATYAGNDDIKCMIITGAGKAFVAGADITEMAKLSSADATSLAQRGHDLMNSIQTFPKPTIAAVNGFALGGGCELAMACDIRLASEKAKFGQPEVNLGIIPGYGGTQRLARLVGRGKAMQLILTGDMIRVDEAYRIGLVDEIYTPDELMDKAVALGELIATKGALAIQVAKGAINSGLGGTLEQGCAIERQAFGKLFDTEDQKEGMTAFMERRAPQFKGK